MKKEIKVLLVEDEVLVAEDLKEVLGENGFKVTGIAISRTECMQLIESSLPDVILMDIKIKGEKDGIELASEINTNRNIPVIYLTANSDTRTRNRVLPTKPYAFISKPFKEKDVIMAIELAFSRYNELLVGKSDLHQFPNDSIFVKAGEVYKKIELMDINYIEASGSYCIIHAEDNKYTISSNLNKFHIEVNNSLFMRIHRTYIINVKKVDSYTISNVVIGKKYLPISKSNRENILSKFQTI